MNKRFFSFIFIFGLLFSLQPVLHAEGVVGAGKTVTVHYTLTVDGEIVDSTLERAPMQYVHGQDQILPGLQTELAGMKAGDKKEFKINPEQGFGPVNDQAYITVPREQMPDPDVEVGLFLTVPTKDGQTLPAVIKEVNDESVVLDFNHPLAGKTLSFKVEVLEIA